jgi:hypothetical protein
MTSGPVSREQVLDELDFLTTVGHALIVEYVSVQCALGHDLQADEGGATTESGREAASGAASLAQGEMFRLQRLNSVLVAAGRSPQLGRAETISSDSVTETPLGPPSQAQLEGMLDREDAIARAVDERYARLRPAVTTDPVFDGALLDQLRSIIVDGTGHAAAWATVRGSLGTMAAADFLRATRRDAADATERRLLDVSDRNYRMIQTALQGQFGDPESFDSATFRALALTAMDSMDDINRLLVQRGLLPPFTL